MGDENRTTNGTSLRVVSTRATDDWKTPTYDVPDLERNANSEAPGRYVNTALKSLCQRASLY